MTYLPGFADLLWLADHAADIVEAKQKGTSRPWQEPASLSPERKREQTARAVAERKDRSHLAPGEHPAPLHLDVLDLLVDLLSTADSIAEEVAQAAGVDRLPSAASAFADPEPYLRHAAAHLSMAYEADPSLIDGVEEDAARLRADVARHLGELTTGQTLKAPCPWCAGRTADHPEGGSFTLRVRTLPGDLTAVVCQNSLCDPPDGDCGSRWRGFPAWPIHEWNWLADHISAKEAS